MWSIQEVAIAFAFLAVLCYVSDKAGQWLEKKRDEREMMNIATGRK